MQSMLYFYMYVCVSENWLLVKHFMQLTRRRPFAAHTVPHIPTCLPCNRRSLLFWLLCITAVRYTSLKNYDLCGKGKSTYGLMGSCLPAIQWLPIQSATLLQQSTFCCLLTSGGVCAMCDTRRSCHTCHSNPTTNWSAAQTYARSSLRHLCYILYCF